MNILGISHSCVTDVNQKQFIALNAIPGVNVELLIPSQWINTYTGKRFEPKLLGGVDFPVHQYPVALPGKITMHYYTRLPRLSDLKYKPDVVLSAQEPYSLSGLQAALLARRFKAPFVFQTNQNILKRYPVPFGWIERFHYRSAAAGLAYSEEARQILIEKGMTIPSDVVPYGTDTSMFKPGRAPELRSSLGLGDACVLGYMGRLVPQKALDVLVRAAARITGDPAAPALKILFVGSGPEETNLRDLANTLGIGDKVVFSGAVPHTDAGRYMQCMDIFVLPSRTTTSWKEQFGRVLIEAMACGMPVIGSDSGAIPVVIRDTKGGLIFKEDDIDDCAGAIGRLLSDPAERERLGGTGAESVRQRYTFEAVARQLVAVIDRHCGVHDHSPAEPTTLGI